MRFNPNKTFIDKFRTILGVILAISGAVMLFFASMSGFVLLPLTFGGIALVLGGIFIARSHRFMELIRDLLQ
jgi:uncharacterized membrane protein HdeD (DUF308 family)